jgi:hypothetical protein
MRLLRRVAVEAQVGSLISFALWVSISWSTEIFGATITSFFTIRAGNPDTSEIIMVSDCYIMTICFIFNFMVIVIANHIACYFGEFYLGYFISRWGKCFIGELSHLVGTIQRKSGEE